MERGPPGDPIDAPEAYNARPRRRRRRIEPVLEPEQLEQGLVLFERLVREDEGLREDFRRSAAQYFLAGAGPDPTTPEGISAARRHLEWFLFERIGDPIRELVAEQLLDRWRANADPELAAHEQTFLESHAGIFAVTDVDPGQGAWLEDLAGLGRYPVAEAEASHLFAVDDLIVGRLFPVGDSLYRISHGAGFFREPDLVRALEDDMQRLRRNRSHQVLRIAQRELEATFWGAERWGGGGDPVGDARRSLLAGGLTPERADAILAALRAAPLEASNRTPGYGDPLGDVLDDLAFDSAVDLGEARVALLLAWQHMGRAASAVGAPGPAAAPSPDAPETEAETDVRRAVAELDQRLQAGQDVLACFDELERTLGLDALPDPEEDEVDSASARRRPGAGRDAGEDDGLEGEDPSDTELGESSKVPDFPGVVGAMVEEFLWEQETLGSALDPTQTQCLRLFAHIERELGVFEELALSNVLRFAVFWLPERGALGGEAEALAALDALERFCRWSEEQHALTQFAGAADKLADLRPGLARATVANRVCGAGHANAQADDGETGELFEFRTATRGRARLRDSHGDELEFQADPEVLRWLQPGDRLRASHADGSLRIHRCYPPQIAQLV